MLQDSMKARDLAHDPRVVLNSIVTSPEPDTEIKLRATVRPESDQRIRQRYATAVATEIGWQPVVGRFALFAVHINDVTYIGYDPETQGQHVARWPSGVEYVRPALTPTSLGSKLPVRLLLH